MTKHVWVDVKTSGLSRVKAEVIAWTIATALSEHLPLDEDGNDVYPSVRVDGAISTSHALVAAHIDGAEIHLNRYAD